MRPNFLAQFAGPRPAPMEWGFDAFSPEGRKVIAWNSGGDLVNALRTTTLIRETHPNTDIRVRARINVLQNGGENGVG